MAVLKYWLLQYKNIVYLFILLNHLQFPWSAFYNFQHIGLCPTSLILMLDLFWYVILSRIFFFFTFSFWYFIISIQEHNRFLCINLVSCNLALFISSTSFWVETLGFSMLLYISFANSNNFTYSLLIWIQFVSFSCLITVSRTSNTM